MAQWITPIQETALDEVCDILAKHFDNSFICTIFVAPMDDRDFVVRQNADLDIKRYLTLLANSMEAQPHKEHIYRAGGGRD